MISPLILSQRGLNVMVCFRTVAIRFGQGFQSLMRTWKIKIIPEWSLSHFKRNKKYFPVFPVRANGIQKVTETNFDKIFVL